MTHMSPGARQFEHALLWHDFLIMCAIHLGFSIANNLMPDARHFRRWPALYCAYLVVVDFIALGALSLRVDIPSLDWEILGFRIRRRVKHFPMLAQRKRPYFNRRFRPRG